MLKRFSTESEGGKLFIAMKTPNNNDVVLESEIHDNACEGLMLALEIHINHFKKLAKERIKIQEERKKGFRRLRRKSRLTMTKNRNKRIMTKASNLRSSTRENISRCQEKMCEHLADINLYQSLMREQLQKTILYYPSVAAKYELEYIRLSELLEQPIEPIEKAAETARTQERVFLQTWIEVRQRIVDTFKEGKFGLPSMEDLGFRVPEKSTSHIAID